MKTLITQIVPSQPTQPKKLLLHASHAHVSVYMDLDLIWPIIDLLQTAGNHMLTQTYANLILILERISNRRKFAYALLLGVN